MTSNQIDPSLPEWWPGTLQLPWSSPSLLAAIVPSVLVVAMVALGACSSDGDPVPATTTGTAGTTVSTPAPSSSSDPAPAPTSIDPTATTADTGDDVAISEARLAFLVGLFDDPAAATDARLAEQFAPTFLAQVPADTIRSVIAEAAAGASPPWTVTSSDLTDLGGTATISSADGIGLTVVFELEPGGEHLIALAQVVPGSIADLEQAFLEPGTLEGSDGVDAAFDAIAPRVTYAVFDATDGACTSLLERNADAVVPTGSSFKLWVLATLARAVRDGDASWDETMPVTGALRSSPDGEVYPLADGTPVTLERLAELMISISDNTATDHLVARLGRERIEATMAELGLSTVDRNTPFLSTAELFKLKFVHPELGDRYLRLATADERRGFLDTEVADAALPWIDDPSWIGGASFTEPRSIDELEWFARPADLCTTFDDLDRLAGLPGLEPVARILELNPGLPFPSGQWQTIRFKGGSEPGVVMFAHWLETAAGERRVVVVSLTDPDRAFGELEPVEPAARLLGLTALELFA